MNARSIATLTALAIGAAASWYLASQGSDDTEQISTTGAPQRGYYLRSARILGTDADGSLLYEIEADEAEQQDGNVIRFSNVRVSYSPTSDVPWIVTADAATIEQDQERVLLRGHVIAVSRDPEVSTEFRTQYLELVPERYLAETGERVQIRIGERSLTATGMLASLNDNRLQLKSNVSGKLLP